jgi:hypothetical protein
MKKAILIFIILIAKLSSYGQLDKNTWLFGGSGSFSSTVSTVTYTSDILSPSRVEGNYDRARFNQITLSPTIGYFLFNKLAVGVKPNLNWTERTHISTSNPGNYTGSGFSRDILIGPFVRYYFLEKEKPFNILFESSYQRSFFSSIYGIKGYSNNISLLAGTALYFNKTIALEFLLGYNRFFRTYKIESAGINYPEINQTFIQKGLQFNVALQFHLEKK